MEEDDRWRNFTESETNKSQGVTNKKSRSELFNEHLTRVLLQKSQRKNQENKCKVASHIIKLITDVAFAMNAEWKTYTTSNRFGVKTAPLRTLAEDVYECMVPLARPMRLDGFSIVQKSIDEMPQHRCLLQVNNKLCKEEAYLVRREWESYVDKDGYLKPAAILDWFNKGLAQAVPVVLTDNHSVDKLACSVGDDGTATLKTTMSDFDGDELDINTFSINIYPVFPMDKIPTSLKLNAPLPCFGNFIQGQKEFRRLVSEDIEMGRDVAFLDPKFEQMVGPIKRCLPNEGRTWKINLSLSEHHVYSLIDKYCKGLNFRHVLVLMNILREENRHELSILNNEILVNTLFNVSQKHINDLRTKEMWVMTVLQTLSDCLKNKFLPSFYLPRQNLLTYYQISKRELARATNALDVIIAGLKRSPRKLYEFSGSVDPYETPGQNNQMRTATRQSILRGAADDYDRKKLDEYIEQVESEEEEETGFYEDTSVANGGWPIVKTQEKEPTHEDCYMYKDEVAEKQQQQQQFEDDSAISKPTRIGERSDIY